MRSIYPGLPGDCPSANVCRVTAGGEAPACGSEREQTPPLEFAENACVLALHGAHDRLLEIKEKRAPSGPTPRTLYIRAWDEWELGMATDNHEAAEAFFAASTAYADQVLFDDTCDPRLRVDAALLRTYTPAFRARRLGEQLEANDVTRIRKGVASTHDFAHALSQDTKHGFNGRAHKVTSRKIALILAAARNGKLVYPASPRESQTEHFQPLRFDVPGVNRTYAKHDAYLCLDAITRLPITMDIGTKVAYSDVVLRFDYRRVVERAMRDLRWGNQPGYRQQFVEIIRAGLTQNAAEDGVPLWLAAEAQGKDIGRPRRLLLDAVSSTLGTMLTKHEKLVYGTQKKPGHIPAPRARAACES